MPERGEPPMRDIERPRGPVAPPRYDEYEEETPPMRPQLQHRIAHVRQRGTPWLLLALGIAAVIVGVSFVLSLLWNGASVTIYPRHERTTVNVSIAAATEPQAGELRYNLFTLERTQTRQVQASSLEQAEEQARGRITVYNEFSESSQRLIKNTRFAAPDGKIYRIRESIVVPGRKPDGTPGSVEVDVFAEEAGEAYNKPATEFTVPGLAGLPQEGKIYAKSTGPLSGGFVGERRTVGEAERTRAYDEMRTALKDELLAAAVAEGSRPEGTLLYGDAVFYELTPGADAAAGDNAVTLSMIGRIHAVLLSEDEFAQYLATRTIAGYDGNPIRIDNPNDLTVTASPLSATGTARGAEESSDSEAEVDSAEESVVSEPWKAVAITLNIRGEALFIWKFDEAALARDIAGQEKSRMFEPPQTSILSTYPGIDRAEASIRPFWKGSFPDDPADISIRTSLDS